MERLCNYHGAPGILMGRDPGMVRDSRLALELYPGDPISW